jgi:hypothetical protein
MQLVEAGLLQDAFRVLSGKNNSLALVHMLARCNENVPLTFEKNAPRLATIRPCSRALLLMFLIAAVSEGQLDAEHVKLRILVKSLDRAHHLLEPLSATLTSTLAQQCRGTVNPMETCQDTEIHLDGTAIQTKESGEHFSGDLTANIDNIQGGLHGSSGPLRICSLARSAAV